MWTNEKKEFKILVIQQNEFLANQITQSLDRYGFRQHKTVYDIFSANQHLMHWNPDFVLIDTHLQNSTQGLRFANELHEKHSIPFIFICNSLDVQLTKDIVEAKSSGILLHPLNELQFIITMNRMIEFNKEKESQLLDLKNKEKIMQDEIMYLQAYGNYWEVITNKGKKLVRKSYSEIISSFPQNNLQRIHRSYIVNKKAVTKFSSSKVQLINGLTLPISRSFQQELRNIS